MQYLKNGGLQHINASIYSNDTTFYILFTSVIYNSDAIIAKNDDPKAYRFEISVYMRMI